MIPGDASAAISSRVFTVPNVLSFIRLLLVPVFLWLVVTGEDFWALVVLVFSSLSDYLDGQIARRFHQVTRLGQLLDPAADRLFIFATLIGLSVRDVIPWWFAAIIVARDLVLLVLGIVLANHGYGPLPVHHLGKLGTFLLYYALPIIMLGLAFPVVSAVTQPVGWAFAIWGTFVYWWAGVIYIGETVRITKIPEVRSARSDTLGK
jgi:cardiolipin synthase